MENRIDNREIQNDLIMKVDTDIELESVILNKENTDKINEFIKENEFKDKFQSYGLEPMNRLLFYGASGCGKTFLAKALSNHLGYKMLYVDIAKSLSDGDVAINISNIFKLGNDLKNCVIFFDECDSIAWNRDESGQDTGTVRRATNSIFQQLDQMDYRNIFIAATNMLHRLDPAFERRFNLKMEFRRPEMNLKDAIKMFMFEDFQLKDDVDPTVQRIVERRTKMSFYEIQGIVERAMKRAVMNNTTVLSTSEIYNDFSVAMRIKINFKTDKDDENIFMSSIK